MEKFFLRALFAGQELNIVDEQNVGLTITLPETDQLVALDGVDKLVRKPLAREVHHFLGLGAFNRLLADRLHQMRLSQADAAVNKKRVVAVSRALGNRHRGSVGQLVIRADDKCVKSVAWIHSMKDGLFRILILGNRERRSHTL